MSAGGLRLAHRGLTDWAGFACFVTLAALAIIRAPRGGAFIVLPLVLLDGFTALVFLTRRGLRRQNNALLPQICAYAGTFGLATFVLLAQKFRPQWFVLGSRPALRIAGSLLWMCGTVVPIWLVWRLRHSFSIVPQARQLVTGGPYRLARHPIYACHFIQAFGYCLVFWNIPLLIALAAWQSIMLLRIRFEERVLQQTFPEYAQYRQQVGMFFPRWRRAPLRAVAAAAAGAPESKAA